MEQSLDAMTSSRMRGKYLSAARLKPTDPATSNAYNSKLNEYEIRRQNPGFKNGSSGMGGVLTQDGLDNQYYTPSKQETSERI